MEMQLTVMEAGVRFLYAFVMVVRPLPALHGLLMGEFDGGQKGRNRADESTTRYAASFAVLLTEKRNNEFYLFYTNPP
jgi:hypothetical protein